MNPSKPLVKKKLNLQILLIKKFLRNKTKSAFFIRVKEPGKRKIIQCCFVDICGFGYLEITKLTGFLFRNLK